MKKVAVALLIIAALVLGTLNYHFILLDSNLKILKKVNYTFKDTFVDGRGSKKYKLLLNPALVQAGVKDLYKREGITIGK
ncbi:MAG: hypothetical protein P8075_21435 [Deltaproteobacteria bacterium]|jgi:hypothetical protein